ncbi:hypothetical protein THRCLA_04907 [Thraustotheca clavata]|uniref:Uncharacterized protein n=1 Tax=Thraustotheca clavata TaxID=74557 RepID=A0A1V9ZXK4_9STRA|nr:hypothetical protein THRCLA_04907 [Thraustotheca clavata]
MDTTSLSTEELLNRVNAPENKQETWKAILDRLVEMDGGQLQQIIQCIKLNLDDNSNVETKTINYLYQAVKKLGCRGEIERKLLIKNDVPKSLILTMKSLLENATALSYALQSLYPLAFDAAHRTYMLGCESIKMTLTTMKLHPKHFAVQQNGCKFLQLMAFDDDCKFEVVQAGGLPLVLTALDEFQTDKDLAVSASDLLYFLVVDLEGESEYLINVVEKIISAAVQVMTLHKSDECIQSHGVAILNSLCTHDQAKVIMCTTQVIDATEQALGCTQDATADASVLLYELLHDKKCKNLLHNNQMKGLQNVLTKIKSIELDNEDSETTQRLEEIQCVISELIENTPITLNDLAKPDVEDKPTQICIEEQVDIQVLPSSSQTFIAPVPIDIVPISDNSEALISPSTKSVQALEDDFCPPSLTNIAENTDEGQVCAPKDELNSNCFKGSKDLVEPKIITARTFSTDMVDDTSVLFTKIDAPKFVPVPAPEPEPRYVPIVSSNSKKIDAPKPAPVPTPEPEPNYVPVVSSTTMRQLEQEFQEAMTEALEKERSKMRKVMFNNKLLQRRLAEQHKLLCVHNERSVADSEIHEALLQRVAHLETLLNESQRACEAERAARLAHETEAMRAHGALAAAMKTIEEQKNRTFKEKTVSEKQFVDIQHLAEALAMEKEVLLDSLKTAHESQRRLEQHLEDMATEMLHTRHEALENLLMREEDVELPQTSQYYVQASPMPKRPTQYTLHKMENNRAEIDDKLCDKKAIETFLFRTYKCLEACSEGNGVHFSILRRYFVDCGMVTPPIVLGDVDMILNKILAIAQENKIKMKQRKDYEFSPCPQRPNFGKLRHRYFSRNLFCEAITLVGAKKYPDVDTPEMLRLVILNHLNPFSKSIETKGDVQLLVSCYDAFGFMKIVLETLHAQYKRDGGCIGKKVNSTTEPRSPTDGMTHDEIMGTMLEMTAVLQREQKPLRIICEFYTASHDVCKDEALDLGLECLVGFAVDFEIIPAFLDRLAVKRLYKDILTYFKTFLAKYTGFPCPIDKKKYVSFYVLLARLAVEIFKDKRDYEMPESQITGLLQWLDNSRGRSRIIRKGSVHAGIKFSNKLYAIKGS